MADTRPTIVSMRPNTKAHDGARCTPVRSVVPEDGEAFDVAIAKTVVVLDDGKEVIVWNIELQF